MCEPTTIAIAATAAGTAASVAGQKKAMRAMGSAQAAENVRQGALRDEANAIFSESLSSNTAKNRVAAETNASTKREAAYTADLAGGKKAEVASSYGSETPLVVADESAARGAAGKMGSAIDARNKAILAGFGDATSDTAVKNARARVNTGVVGDFMKGSASAHGAEMDYASHKGDSLKTVGDILQKIGMVAGGYAAASSAGSGLTKLASEGVTKAGAMEAATSGGWMVPSNTPGGWIVPVA